MDTVKVKNNEPRLHQFVAVTGGKREVRTLKPGVNLVPKPVVEEWKKLKVFQSHLELKHLEIEGDIDGAVADSLDGMKVLDAVKLVNDTLDVAQLEKWKTTTKVGRIAAAIDTQLAKIDATAKKE